ncbi:YolD-like family protein [Alteribacter keqinensis]|uniref:YolD-like family protein n=1 Tax=Alteribacter keqinensis TaxID=2483800 RepID=A0A3M7TQ09_9BACI|nr:YolD-like family protein [Alteribacter keqinensis]RNA67097.1 YolD-like family protein [Alteribacter keqinensis]
MKKDNKLRDRGTIKWTSLMLPEHVGMLNTWFEGTKKQPRPELDEQQWEEIGQTVCEGMAFHSELVFTFWEDGFFYQVSGYAEHVNTHKKLLYIRDKEEEQHVIPLKNIIDVKSG